MTVIAGRAWAQADQPKSAPAAKAAAPDLKAAPPKTTAPAPKAAATPPKATPPAPKADAPKGAATKAPEAQPVPDAAATAPEAAGAGEPAAESAEPAKPEPDSQQSMDEAEKQMEETGSPETGKGLPEGFKPRDARPKMMEFTKELLTETREGELRKELIEAHYRTKLREGSLNNDTRELMKKIAQYDVYRMTMEKYHQQIATIREELFLDISSAAMSVKNDADRDQFRRVFLQEVRDRAVELLDGNYHVRINAAITLWQMNVRDAVPPRTPPVPFELTFKPLMDIVRNDSQPDAVKLIAVNGLNRLSLAGSLSTTDRIDAATALIAEIKRPKTHFVYQERLVQTLARIDLAVDRDDRAFIVQMLTEVVADNGRHWLVRSEAAKGLGRAKWDRRINAQKVVYEIVHLTRETVEGFNKEPTAFYWRDCFFDLYLAFVPLDADEKQKGFGLLTKDPTNAFIESAYRQVVPLTNHVSMKQSVQPVDSQRIIDLDDWLKKNTPDNHSVAPNLPPIVTKQAEETARTGAPR